jgi:hypothetical protein
MSEHYIEALDESDEIELEDRENAAYKSGPLGDWGI